LGPSEGTFKVRVDGIRFDAAHFATFGGSCEPLHGHSYEVSATVEGPLAEHDSWVFDFIELKAILRTLCEELDHRFLLQAGSHVLKIAREDKVWHISTPRGTSYALPSRDVVALDVDNTTAERLSQWFSKRLWQEVIARQKAHVELVSVEVSEGPGQRAVHTLTRLP
jgi:6-pyruvoyltetrahydropterin/6-carboxytetrahydropterin synthase